MTTIADRFATPEAPILDILAERWSTRVFDASAPIDEAALTSALEAARWAPSASNTQPVRFIVARRGSEAHAAVFDALMDFNQVWAGDASALVVVLAQTETDDGTPLRWALYDAGQAAAHLTVQAHADGVYTHQMGGFHPDKIRAAFDLDERLQPMAVMAVGRLGVFAKALPKVQERESRPRTRRPIAESILIDQ